MSVPYEAEGPVTSHLHSTSTTYVTSNGVAKATAPRVTDGLEGDDTLMPPIERARKREGLGVGGGGVVQCCEHEGGIKPLEYIESLMVPGWRKKKEYLANKL